MRQSMLPPSSGQASASARSHLSAWLLVVLAVLVALALRLPGVSASPLAFHPVRQYTGLALARAQYLAMDSSAIDPALDAAVQKTGQAVPRLEPRLIEPVVAFGYVLLGGERRWLGGVLSSVLWVVGGVLLFLLARRLASVVAAAVAMVFHLFLPYGVIASRSIQHDSAMVTSMLAALLAIIRWEERPTTRRLLACAALSSLAILIKPVCAFFLVGAFLALSIHGRGFANGVLQPAGAMFVAIALLPSGLPYLYRVVSGVDIASHYVDVAFAPSLRPP